MPFLRSLLLLAIALQFATCQTPAVPVPAAAAEINNPTTVFLVRHSEKESGSNPALSTAGLERSQLLTQLLSEVKFDAIFSTPFQRTEMTAAAVCDVQGMDMITYDHKDLPGLAKLIEQDYRGGQVLVVGHSNTTPMLTGILDGTNAHTGFDESDYGNLMMVIIPAEGPAKTIKLRF